MTTSSQSATQVVEKQANLLKILGGLLVLGSTGGCIVGAGADSNGISSLSIAFFFVGLILFIVGRSQD